MTERSVRFWPFPVSTADWQNEQYSKHLRFLEEAFASGFRPREDRQVTLEGDYLAESDDGRCGTIYYRGGNRWEVGLYENQTRPQAFWTDDFAHAGAAVLVWLRGGTAADVLAAVEGHVIRGRVILEPAAADGAPAS